MRGRVCHTIGKVTFADAGRFEGAERHALLQEAADWYKRSIDELASTQAYSDMAEIYGDWAEALETLGQTQEAIERWRCGYEVLSATKERQW
jgi:hypothetical protein